MKTKFKKVILLVTAVALALLTSISAIPAIAAGESTKYPTYEIGTENAAALDETLQTMNISLSGQITMIFRFGNVGNRHSHLKITVPQQDGDFKTTILNKDSIKRNGDVYEVSVSLAAAQQTDLIELQWFDVEDQPGKSRKYSVRYYADKIMSLAEEDGADEQLLKLEQTVKSMLNYGAMAQLTLSYRTDNLANEGIYTKDNNPIKNMLAEHFYGATPGVLKDSEDESITFDGVQVFLRDTVRMRVYVNAPEGATATVNGNEVSINEDENGTYVGVYNIFANKFSDVFKVEITANGQTATADYSVLGWCLDTLRSDTTEEMKNVARAAYMYYTHTTAYVDPTHTPGAASCPHERLHTDGGSILCSDCYKNVSGYTRLSLSASELELVAGVPTDVQITLSANGPVDLSVLSVTLKADSGITLAYKEDSAIFGDGSGNLGGSIGRNIVIEGATVTEAGALVTLTYTVTAAESGTYKLAAVVRGAINGNGDDITETVISSFETVKVTDPTAN